MDLFEWSKQNSIGSAVAAHNPRKQPAEALDSEFFSVAAELAQHRGARSAIRAIDIADECNLLPEADYDSRRCKAREIIRRHFDDFDFPVMADSNGYYIPTSAEEVAHYDRNLVSRIRKTASRLSAFRRQCRTAGFQYAGKGHWLPPSADS